jgi:catechol 2,3-dioxygenase-like lactoylglutathione lyase family enzyme
VAAVYSLKLEAGAPVLPGPRHDQGVERETMFSHMMVGSNDLVRSRRFYDALFGALGAKPGIEDEKGRLFYTHQGAFFLVTKPIDGKPASAGNGMTIGMSVTGPEQADAWHAAGVANGGTAIEDPPGVRPSGMGPLYLAYLRDPDGNKLCALHPVGGA